jgi:nitrogen fixation/metabolism regulation signal transduction histidine kinase
MEAHGDLNPHPRRADDAFIEARVSDTGPGFSREYAENGIQPLSSSRAKGLGIGLPYADQSSKPIAAVLWLDKVSQGASIRFTLPISGKCAHD